MFVYYLDGCLTVYWQLFVLSLWVVTLFFIIVNGRKLLHAKATLASLKDAGITGRAFERMKPNPAKNLRWLVIWCAASIAVLYGYAAFFSSFECTPDSFLWVR